MTRSIIVGNCPIVKHYFWATTHSPSRSALGKIPLMDKQPEPWREIILAAIKALDKPDRTIGVEAGLGETFVRDFRDRGQIPRVDTLQKICRYLGLDVASLFSEGHMSSEDVAFEMERSALARAFKQVAELPPDGQKLILQTVRGMVASMKPRNPEPMEKRAKNRRAA